MEAIKRRRRARKVPTVHVYSRHTSDCKWDDDTKISCKCPKSLVWYRAGKLHRDPAETCDDEVAKKKARALMDSFEAAAEGKPLPASSSGKLLDEAVNLHLASLAKSGVTNAHVMRTRFDLEAFAKFALGRSLVNLGDILTEHVLEYRNSLDGALNTRAKKVQRLRSFFIFCTDMGWITRDPAKAKAVTLKSEQTQKPKALTDEQFNALLAAVPKVNGRPTDEQRSKLTSLAVLMKWTGMAIRDAVTIERNRFEKNGCGFYKLLLRRAKTGKPVYCTIRAEIVEKIFAGANPDGRYLFVASVPADERGLNNLTKNWGSLFTKIGEAAALTDEHGEALRVTSHWMRHSFAFWCFSHGMPTEDVAMLLGDTVAVVAQTYSDWIHGRQERLTERMIEMLQ